MEKGIPSEIPNIPVEENHGDKAEQPNDTRGQETPNKDSQPRATERKRYTGGARAS